MGNQSEEHSILINDLILAIGSRRDVRCWKNHSGIAVLPTGQRIRYGMPDTPDIIGFCSDGIFLGIEGKTGGAVKSTGQRRFHNMAAKFLTRCITVYSVAEATSFLDSLKLPQIDLTALFK